MARIKRSNESMEMGYFDALELFLQEKRAMNLAEVSVKRYEYEIAAIGDYLGFTEETPANELTLNKIYQLINHYKKEEVSGATIQHHIRNIRVFAYWCMHEDRKYITPAYKIKMPKAQEEQLKFYNDEEIALLLEKPKRNANFVEWRNWAVAAWVLGTGNRAATICDIKLKDIDYSRKEIMLHHTKNKRAQIIPLSAALEIVLKEYVRMWRKGEDKEAYLFPTQDNYKNNTDALSTSFKRYCAARGVQHRGVHALRHTFARLYIKNGGNAFKLQKILGHQDISMTKNYVRLFGEDLKDDYEEFSPLDNIRRKTSRTKTIKRS